MERFSLIERDAKYKDYLSDQLFCVFTRTLRHLENDYDDLSPSEIWYEACDMAKRLGESRRSDIEVRDLRLELIKRYSIFLDSGQIIHRTRQQAELTTMSVLMALLYMLASKNDGSMEDNPYRNFCAQLAEHVVRHPDWKRVYNLIRKNEDEEEKSGHEVRAYDYMHPQTSTTSPAYAIPHQQPKDDQLNHLIALTVNALQQPSDTGEAFIEYAQDWAAVEILFYCKHHKIKKTNSHTPFVSVIQKMPEIQCKVQLSANALSEMSGIVDVSDFPKIKKVPDADPDKYNRLLGLIQSYLRLYKRFLSISHPLSLP